MIKALTVQLKERSYPIYFDGALEKLKQVIQEAQASNKTCFLISDKSLQTHQLALIEQLDIESEKIFYLPSGEHSKSMDRYSEILSFLAQHSANRDSILFALGGGVVGDLVGFIAATYLRGIDFYQIPTTLLAMVDSSVGGKTGINLPEGKNLVGAFCQPQAVFIDPSFLSTLSDAEFASGLAEVIKYGLIADREFYEYLIQISPLDKDSKALPEVIKKCCSIKADVVADDEKETANSGGRALLNLGHTFGHAIENVSGYGDYLHGEAIAIGMHLACLLSEACYGSFSEEDTASVIKLLSASKLPVRLKEALPIDSLNEAITRDKKNRASGLKFITLRSIGKAESLTGVDPKLINSLWANVGAQ